jgi:hypothetical protein
MIEARERVPEHTTEPEVERDAQGPNLMPHRPFDVERVRADFPILHTLARGKPLIYLDNGATTQKPQAVMTGWCSIIRARTPTFIAACITSAKSLRANMKKHV